MSKTIFVLLVLITSLVQPQQRVSALDISPGGCPTEIDSTFACRSYRPESGELEGKVDTFTVIVLRYGSIPVATRAYAELGVNGYPSDSDGHTFNGVSLGDEYVYFPPANSSSGQMKVSFLKVRDENIISLWIVEGNEVELATALTFSYSNWDYPQGIATNTASITEFLPDHSVLPSGLVLTEEFPSITETKPDKEVTRTPRTTAAPTSAASKTGTSSSTSSSTSSGSIEILDISNKDAGYGNGNYYIYVEVKNNTGRYLSYVHVDLTCRDTNGSVVGTGIANYAGIGPGETVVLTGLMLDVPECVTVNARVNPLTG